MTHRAAMDRSDRHAECLVDCTDDQQCPEGMGCMAEGYCDWAAPGTEAQTISPSCYDEAVISSDVKVLQSVVTMMKRLQCTTRLYL